MYLIPERIILFKNDTELSSKKKQINARKLEIVK